MAVLTAVFSGLTVVRVIVVCLFVCLLVCLFVCFIQSRKYEFGATKLQSPFAAEKIKLSLQIVTIKAKVTDPGITGSSSAAL